MDLLGCQFHSFSTRRRTSQVRLCRLHSDTVGGAVPRCTLSVLKRFRSLNQEVCAVCTVCRIWKSTSLPGYIIMLSVNTLRRFRPSAVSQLFSSIHTTTAPHGPFLRPSCVRGVGGQQLTLPVHRRTFPNLENKVQITWLSEDRFTTKYSPSLYCIDMFVWINKASTSLFLG